MIIAARPAGNRATIALAILIAALILSSCAPGPNTLAGVPAGDGKVSGFWQGLWNGMTAPITFVISLFNKGVSPYEVHNNGNWYNFGFLIGASVALGGGGAGGASARKRRR